MLRGTLDTFSVGEILELVGASRASGALRVRSDRDEGVVQCHDGAVTLATVGAGRDLGAVLVRGGFVTEGEWPSIAQSAEPAVQLVEVLERNSIDADRVHRYIASQTEESVFELDSWTMGDLQLEADADDALSTFFRYPTEDLLATLVARRREWKGLLDTLGSPDRIVHQASIGVDDDSEMRVSRAQLVLLSRIDGQRSVRELARFMGSGLFHTCKLVASLVDEGLVTLSADRSVTSTSTLPAPPPPAPPARPVAAPTPAPAPPTASPEFVEVGDGPARDLIVRLLSAVKEEL